MLLSAFWHFISDSVALCSTYLAIDKPKKLCINFGSKIYLPLPVKLFTKILYILLALSSYHLFITLYIKIWFIGRIYGHTFLRVKSLFRTIKEKDVFLEIWKLFKLHFSINRVCKRLWVCVRIANHNKLNYSQPSAH